jgi:signal-transduction protein with cAMP-binding, CBS, and nucleotidyltransferase domain
MFDHAATADFLATLPLLEGMPEAELAELARVMRRRDLPTGEVLWRQGDKADAMLLVVEGAVSMSLRLPGNRAVEFSRRRPGDVLGEIPLLDGGRHSGTAQVVEAARLLSLSRADFAALVSRRHPTAFALKRRLAGVACMRLREQWAGWPSRWTAAGRTCRRPTSARSWSSAARRTAPMSAGSPTSARSTRLRSGAF